ncbi:MAG: phospholipase D-like domain-containing protein [Clostridia bacterium]|nr:phospholipase D-like domain-containing protein [Clostridia bacterium]
MYDGLVNKDLSKNHTSTKDEIFAFNKRAYGSHLTTKNNVEIINSYSKFVETLTKDLNNADKYIIFEVTKINVNNFSNIKDVLISKAQEGVNVKFVYEEFLRCKFIKELKKAGVKVYKFSKHNLEHTYSNHRNLISIDGEIAYMGNFYIKSSQIQQKVHSANMYLRLKGEIVQDVDVAVHKDVVFASGKFVEYTGKYDNLTSTCNTQFISNEISNDIELMLTKAICGAKTSIQLLLTQFIPTENIVSLLKYAINSNISVRIMVPLKSDFNGKCFASRAYAKELALAGADVYLYDGYIRFNSVVIDSQYAYTGSFVFDREYLKSSLQNVLVVENEKVVNHLNKFFDVCVENSYRIKDAKYMLIREKFFKNFV